MTCLWCLVLSVFMVFASVLRGCCVPCVACLACPAFPALIHCCVVWCMMAAVSVELYEVLQCCLV